MLKQTPTACNIIHIVNYCTPKIRSSGGQTEREGREGEEQTDTQAGTQAKNISRCTDSSSCSSRSWVRPGSFCVLCFI